MSVFTDPAVSFELFASDDLRDVDFGDRNDQGRNFMMRWNQDLEIFEESWQAESFIDLAS